MFLSPLTRFCLQRPIDSSVLIEEIDDTLSDSRPYFSFRITFRDVNPPRILIFAADVSSERTRWVSALNAAVQGLPLLGRAELAASMPAGISHQAASPTTPTASPRAEGMPPISPAPVLVAAPPKVWRAFC